MIVFKDFFGALLRLQSIVVIANGRHNRQEKDREGEEEQEVEEQEEEEEEWIVILLKDICNHPLLTHTHTHTRRHPNQPPFKYTSHSLLTFSLFKY